MTTKSVHKKPVGTRTASAPAERRWTPAPRDNEIIFMIFYLPETKEKTLKEIEHFWLKKRN